MSLPIQQWTPETKIELGNYYIGMPNEIYHASAGDSKSSIDVFHKDPYKYFHRKQKAQTRPMQLGSAIHCAMLEPEVFATEYMMLPELKDRRQAEYKQAVKSFGEGKVFTNADCEKISGMQKAIWNNEEAARYLKADGYTELSGFTTDSETGLLIRHRFDKLAIIDGKYYAVDLKKTTDVDDYALSKKIWDYRYHAQDVIYSDGFKQITGEDLAGFIFIFIEEEYPHKIAIKELCDLSRKIARDEVRMDLNSLAEYKAGKITAHNNSSCEIISLPEWVMSQFEQEVI